jgi:hypothetical protein
MIMPTALSFCLLITTYFIIQIQIRLEEDFLEKQHRQEYINYKQQNKKTYLIMEHKHTYDAKGKQLCCTQQEKIYTNAGASSLLEDGHSKKDGHNHSEHSDEDGHDHSKGNDSVVKMFLPAIFHYVYYLLLLHLIIIFHNRGLQVGYELFGI